MTGRIPIRFAKPTPWEWAKAFGVSLVAVYLLSIPLSWFFIQSSGMGYKGRHLSAGDVLGAIVMLCLLWAPMTCVYLSWALVPLALLASFVGAGVRKARLGG